MTWEAIWYRCIKVLHNRSEARDYIEWLISILKIIFIVTEDMKKEYYKHHSISFIVFDLLITQGTSFFYTRWISRKVLFLNPIYSRWWWWWWLLYCHYLCLYNLRQGRIWRCYKRCYELLVSYLIVKYTKWLFLITWFTHS